MNRFLLPFLTPVLLLVTSIVHAQLRVEISGVGANQVPIAVTNFVSDTGIPQNISTIIKADLERSGVFKLINNNETLSESASVQASDWKTKGADALVTGSVQRLIDNRTTIRYRLLDTLKSSTLSGLSITSSPAGTRLAAHKIADDIYEKLLGTPGIFSTKIAYIAKNGSEYKLDISDSDGNNPQTLLRSNEPIISPSWSPDGSKIAYVSFEAKKPVIYVQNLTTQQRTLVANYKGNNSAPAWSPSGSELAIALSRDGSTQIYLLNPDNGQLRRLSRSNGIDTEPQFAPDGQTIYFTSDRSGGPQIYKMNLQGNDVQRVTFNGNYNISPRLAPDGKTLAYIARREGQFQLHVLDLATAQEQRLSDTTKDESPSFSPNSKYLLYVTESGRQNTLAVVSTDGKVRYRLATQSGDVREPTWGPFVK